MFYIFFFLFIFVTGRYSAVWIHMACHADTIEYTRRQKISQPERSKRMKTKMRRNKGLPLINEKTGKDIPSWKLISKYNCKIEMLC
jgi:hypothetical protein